MGAPSLLQVTSATAPRGKDETVPVPAPAVSAPPPADVETPAPVPVPVAVPAIDRAPPPEVALLHILADGQGIKVQGHEGTTVRLEATSTRPRQALIEKDLPPKRVDTYLDLLKQDPAIQKLVQWVKQLRAAHPEGVCLVIQEHTSTGIPWEMLKVARSYLGALVTTVRWEDFVATGEDTSKTLTFDEARCGGGVVSYVVPRVTEDSSITPEEKAAVERNLQMLLRGDPRFREIKALRKALCKEQGGVGLVYLLCHGLFVDDFPDSFLGSLSDEKERLTYEDLRVPTMRLLQRSAPVVFLDACSVGRMKDDDPNLTHGLRYGFPQLFLGHGARAVIGALARVDVAYAVRLAKDLVELSRNHPERSLPELLRQLREQAAAELEHALEEDPDDKACWARWYYTFLYVYYGYPMTRLAVTRGEAGHD